MIYNIDLTLALYLYRLFLFFLRNQYKKVEKFRIRYSFYFATVFLSIVFDIASSYANSFPLTYSRALC